MAALARGKLTAASSILMSRYPGHSVMALVLVPAMLCSPPPFWRGKRGRGGGAPLCRGHRRAIDTVVAGVMPLLSFPFTPKAGHDVSWPYEDEATPTRARIISFPAAGGGRVKFVP